MQDEPLYARLDEKDADIMGKLSDESVQILRLISVEFRRIQTGLNDAQVSAERYRKHMEHRMDILEQHIDPNALAKRAEQDAQHRIMWTVLKVVLGTIGTGLIAAGLVAVGIPKP